MLRRWIGLALLFIVPVACEISKSEDEDPSSTNVDGGTDAAAEASPATQDAAGSDAEATDASGTSTPDGSTPDGSTPDGSTPDGSTSDAGFDAGFCASNLEPLNTNDEDQDGWSVLAGDCNDCNSALTPVSGCP